MPMFFLWCTQRYVTLPTLAQCINTSVCVCVCVCVCMCVTLSTSELIIIVTCANRVAHINPLLRQLHWLPINYRFNYKMVKLEYKVYSRGEFRQTYFHQSTTVLQPDIYIRSFSQYLLSCKDGDYYGRAFSHLLHPFGTTSLSTSAVPSHSAVFERNTLQP